MKIKLLVLSLLLFGTAHAQSPSFLWATAAGGTDFDDGNSITADDNGNVYVTGYFQSPTITFGTTTLTNTGSFDIFIAKYDPNGNVLWAKSAGGSADDVGQGITTDSDGNVLITGYFYSPSITFETTTLTNASMGANDIFVVKYDTDGNVLWAKKEGGTYYDFGKSISTDANGNVFVTGNFSSDFMTVGNDTLTNNSMFGWDIFILKYDANGNVLWADGAGGTGGEYSNNIATNQNGDVCITGYFYGPSITFQTTTLNNSGQPNMDSDLFVVKYDANGNVVWATSEGAANNDVAKSITTDANGNIFVAGYFKGPSFSFGTTNLTNSSIDKHDVLVLKYDANGNPLWARSAIGTGSDLTESIHTDANGDILVTGSFYSSSFSFGTSTLINANTSANSSDIFLVKFDPAGNVIWEEDAGGTDNDVAFGVTSDANGNTFITGYFHSDSISFGTTTLTTTGGSIFVTKLGAVTTSIDAVSYHSTINIFPNPSSSSATIEAKENFNDATLTILDSFGRTVLEINNISGQSLVLSSDKLANGTYFVQLKDENRIYTNKLVICKN